MPHTCAHVPLRASDLFLAVMPDGGAVACVVTGTLGLSGWDTPDHSQLGKVEEVLGFWFSAGGVGPALSKVA